MFNIWVYVKIIDPFSLQLQHGNTKILRKKFNYIVGRLKYNATLASFLSSCRMKIHFKKRATVALSERSGKCSHQQKESSWLDASFIRSLQTVAELISTHFYATAKSSNLLYKNNKEKQAL